MNERLVIVVCIGLVSIVSCRTTSLDTSEHQIDQSLSRSDEGGSLSQVISNQHLRKEVVHFLATTSGPIVHITASSDVNAVVLSNALCIPGQALRPKEVKRVEAYIREMRARQPELFLGQDTTADFTRDLKYFEWEDHLLITSLPDSVLNEHMNVDGFCIDFSELIGTEYECEGLGFFEPTTLTVNLGEQDH